MLAVPPVKPRGFSRVSQSSKNQYTIHSKPSDVFTLRTRDDKTAIVAFHRRDDAILMAKMMEIYFRQQNELPSVQLDNVDNALYLPQTDNTKLEYLYLNENQFDDLKVTCTRNILHMISVEKLKENKYGYSVTGNLYKFDAPVEFYQIRFEELLEE
jgi:hypothetical protein